jgi:hypothetical protein
MLPISVTAESLKYEGHGPGHLSKIIVKMVKSMVQMVKCLLSKGKTLRSSISTAKKKSQISNHTLLLKESKIKNKLNSITAKESK